MTQGIPWRTEFIVRRIIASDDEIPNGKWIY